MTIVLTTSQQPRGSCSREILYSTWEAVCWYMYDECI